MHVCFRWRQLRRCEAQACWVAHPGRQANKQSPFHLTPPLGCRCGYSNYITGKEVAEDSGSVTASCPADSFGLPGCKMVVSADYRPFYGLIDKPQCNVTGLYE